MANIIETLKERGFVEAMTNEELATLLKEPTKIYCGFDPTGDSLHLGHLVALMGLAWFQKFGHTPVALVGGATGMIGDPSGKQHERQLLDEATIEKNIQGIEQNLSALLNFDGDNAAIILNNFDWFKNFSCVDFLRDVGKHFRIGPMLAKESVKQRFNSEEGMSFTEFSYQLLQGYDFLYLLDNHKVTMQMGGSDQWGNITAGIELIRKVRGTPTHGITFPLLTRSDGQKFGKTEQGAIWLSSEKLSPYEFYQYLIRIPDEDVTKLMRLLTFMEMDEIRHYEKIMAESDYEPNTAQKKLAEEVTRNVHGEEKLKTAQKVTRGVQPGSEATLDAETLEIISQDMPSYSVESRDVAEQKLVDLIANLQILKSKGEVRRLIRNGGVYVNNGKVQDENLTLKQGDLIDGRLMLIALGKKNKVIIKVER